LPNRRIRLERLEADADRREEPFVSTLTAEDREQFSEDKEFLIDLFQKQIREGQELLKPPANPNATWVLIERLIDIAYNREQARLRDEARQKESEDIKEQLSMRPASNEDGESNSASSRRAADIRVARRPTPIAVAK